VTVFRTQAEHDAYWVRVEALSRQLCRDDHRNPDWRGHFGDDDPWWFHYSGIAIERLEAAEPTSHRVAA
jgi:hypothetical protein